MRRLKCRRLRPPEGVCPDVVTAGRIWAGKSAAGGLAPGKTGRRFGVAKNPEKKPCRAPPKGTEHYANEPDAKAILPEPRSVQKAISYQSAKVVFLTDGRSKRIQFGKLSMAMIPAEDRGNEGNTAFSPRIPAPLTRVDALAAWAKFLPRVKEYAARRNHLELGCDNVSRLSAALRYRLLIEDEVVCDTLAHFSFSAAEKWLQELCWRRYWKGWLEMRPQVWTSWRQRVRELRDTLPQEVLDKADAVAAGESGVACMDILARELIETGYLHNHARMWWASFWIHAEGLPWELGADFFFRHLLDADPASNTLSWRWVAGLQTPGKTYLVRLSNLEKYANGELLRDRRGSHRIADGAVTPSLQQEHADTSKRPLPEFPTSLPARAGRRGLWLHADDLAPEIGPLAEFAPDAVAAFTSERTYREHYRLGENRIAALRTVLGDGIARAAAHYRCPATLTDADDTAAGIVAWARSQQLTEVVGFAPTVGPVGDLVPRLSKQLAGLGIRLTLIQRESDAHAFRLASSGFFPFWEKMSRHLRTNVPA